MTNKKRWGLAGRVVRLRNLGLTWKQVAERTGFESTSGPLEMYKRSAKKKEGQGGVMEYELD